MLHKTLQHFLFWLLQLKECGRCSGLFQRLNLEALCDQCLHKRIE